MDWRKLFGNTLALLIICSSNVVCGKNTHNDVFHPAFKSLQITDSQNLLGQPIVVSSNAGSKVIISFDELAEDSRFLRYRLVHCDSNWRPSEISEMDYIDGFNEGQIHSYELSENTLTHYVHYSLEFPNEDVTTLISGNYLVEIYDEDDPETTLLQARFMISEDVARLSPGITSRTDYDYNGKYQQLSLNVNFEGANIENPYTDLRLVIIPNGQDNNRRVLNAPLRATPTEVVYEHQKDLIFPAGNEYRRFDIANVRYPGMHVYNYEYIEPFYNAMLMEDMPRIYERYQYDSDQSGRFFVDELNAEYPEIQADYIVAFFTLRMPKISEDVYIDGDLTLRKFDSDSRMVYDDTLGAYIKTLLLKQGMYNYQYVTESGGLNPIEGDFYETGNEYLLLLYYRPMGARYDRLIGSTVIVSNK